MPMEEVSHGFCFTPLNLHGTRGSAAQHLDCSVAFDVSANGAIVTDGVGSHIDATISDASNDDTTTIEETKIDEICDALSDIRLKTVASVNANTTSIPKLEKNVLPFTTILMMDHANSALDCSANDGAGSLADGEILVANCEVPAPH